MDACGIQTDLEHIQRFLLAQTAVLGPSVVQVTQSQHSSFMTRIGRLVSLPAEQAGQLTATVQAGPWTEDQKVQLCSAIAMKLTTHSNAKATGTSVRRSNQEIRTFYNYLSIDDKSVLEDPAATTSTKIGLACQRSLTIGLDIPSESSMKHIVAVVCGLGIKNFESDHEGLYGLVAEYKRFMKSFRTKAIAPPNCEFVSHYPATPKDLPPAIYTHAYKSAEPWTCCDAVIAEINAIELRVPLRRSSKLVKPSPAVTQSQSMPIAPPWMQAMCQMVLGGCQQQQQQLNIQYLAPSRSAASPVLPNSSAVLHALASTPSSPELPIMPSIASPQSVAPQQSVDQKGDGLLALQDKPPTELSTKAQMDAFVAAHTERGAAREESKTKSTGSATPIKKGHNAKAKTTATKPVTPPKTKKSSKTANKKSSSAASAQVTPKPWHSIVQQAVGKQQWLKRANGCGKCRAKPFCTPSCWRGRGVNV
jgi:hypothetical protein